MEAGLESMNAFMSVLSAAAVLLMDGQWPGPATLQCLLHCVSLLSCCSMFRIVSRVRERQVWWRSSQQYLLHQNNHFSP